MLARIALILVAAWAFAGAIFGAVQAFGGDMGYVHDAASCASAARNFPVLEAMLFIGGIVVGGVLLGLRNDKRFLLVSGFLMTAAISAVVLGATLAFDIYTAQYVHCTDPYKGLPHNSGASFMGFGELALGLVLAVACIRASRK